MKVSFTGQLAHHFWGDYFCTIALAFDDKSIAEGMQTKLGEKWQPGKNPGALVGHLDSPGLDAFKSQLKAWGLSEEEIRKIDSVKYSIDRGEVFGGDLNVDLTPPEQTKLFNSPAFR